MRKSKIWEIQPFGVDDPEEIKNIPVEVMTRKEATAFLLGAEDVTTATSRADVKGKEMRKRDQVGVQSPPEPVGEIELWRVAIYDGLKVWIAYTVNGDSQPSKFIHVERWDETKQRTDGSGGTLALGGGSPDGPFKHEVFQPVPNTMLGLPGLASIFDLHAAGVKISRKLVSQLLALKKLLVYSGSGDDAMKVTKAQDQDAIKVRDFKSFATVDVGGTRNELEPGMEMLGQWFQNQGGGVRQLAAGSAQAANTATAATYLQNGASMRLGRFRNRLWMLAARCLEEIAFLSLFADPWAYRELEMPLGPGISVGVVFNRAEIAADAVSFMFDVEPFSVPLYDPTAQQQRIAAFVAFVQPLIPLMQVGMVNPAAVARVGRVDFGLDDVDDLFNLDNMQTMATTALLQQNQQALQPAPVQNIVRNAMQGPAQVQRGAANARGQPGRAGGAGNRPPPAQQRPGAGSARPQPAFAGA